VPEIFFPVKRKILPERNVPGPEEQSVLFASAIFTHHINNNWFCNDTLSFKRDQNCLFYKIKLSIFGALIGFRVYISSEIKNLSLSRGAEKCGIASVDRFKNAPDGFHPKDIYTRCKSVIVLLIQMPAEIILASNPVPHSHTAHLIYSKLDKIGLEFCKAIQSNGNHAVPGLVNHAFGS
jgi:hypothetical protein